MTDTLLIILATCALAYLAREIKARPRFDPRMKPRHDYLDPHKR